jgi:hypothetical protein
MSNESEKKSSSGGGWIYSVILLLVVLMIFLWYAKGCAAEHKANVDAEEVVTRARAAYMAAIHPPAPTVVKIGQERKLYLFADFPDGVIKVPVHVGRVDFNVKGVGEIEITTPSGKTYKVSPGDLKPDVGLTIGTYVIKKGENSRALGVEIWN